VLLPIWIAAYRYNNKVYRFLVNGQTGEVVGNAPWSVWKILTLVAAILAFVSIIVVIANTQQRVNTPSGPELTSPTPVAPAIVTPPPTATATATTTASPHPTASTVHPTGPHPTATSSSGKTPLPPHSAHTTH
jgi:hypothetical protein